MKLTATIGLLVSASLSPIVSAQAYGQTLKSPSSQKDMPGNAGNANSADGGEIVVTAQKRSENIQKVPIAIVAQTGEQLENSGVASSLQLNSVAPGLNIRTTVGAFQPYIRGIGTSASIVENPVALYIDGVYYPQQREGVREFNDIVQIAVLKGPQGTLFGRNATGGVIQITTKTPSHTLGGEVNLSYANYEAVHGDAYLTGPLGDQVAFSLSAYYSHQGKGWGKNYSTGNDTYRLDHDYGVRGKLLIEPSPDTKFTIIADYMNRYQHSSAFQPYPGTEFGYEGLIGPDGNVIDFGPVKTVYDTYGAVDSTLSTKGWGVSVQADQQLSFAKLVTISSYRESVGSYIFDTSYVSPSLGSSQAPGQNTYTHTEEIQLLSNSNGPVTWTAGAYYFWYHNDNLHNLRIRIPPFTSPGVSLTQGTEITESVAPYAQIDWEFMPNTKLTVGGRYTWEKRKLTGSRNPSTSATNPVPGPAVPSQAQSISEPTWRVALSRDFSPDVSAYLSYNRGFKSGGFNILNPLTPAYQPEKLDAYEIGIKTRLFDRRAHFNVAGFYYDYTNVQVIRLTPLGQTVDNGAKARIYGLDVDFDAQLTDALSVNGGFEILDAKFTSYPNAPVNGPITGKGATIVAGDVSGNWLPLAQPFSGKFGADYDAALGGGRLHLNVMANYNGRYFFEPDNFLKQGAYTLVNASAKYTLPGDHMSVTVWGRNLTDEKVITQVNTVTQTGYPAAYGQAPRTYGVTVHMSF